MHRKNVYLCGAITDDPITWEWRLEAEKWFGDRDINAVNPMRGKNKSKITDNGLKGSIPGRQFVPRDFSDVRCSNAILANFLLMADRQMVGSLMELGYGYAHNVPIVIVAEAPEFINHPFLTITAVDIAPSLEEGMEIVRFLLM